MAERCAVVGIGQTHHTKCRDDVSLAGLLREAALRALEDAGMTWKDIDAVVLGKAPDLFEGVMMTELFMADALGRDYVFSRRWKDAPLSSCGAHKRELDKLTLIQPPWVIHDFRRSISTGLADLGVAPYVCEALLNHQIDDGGRVKDPKIMKTMKSFL